LSRPGDLVTTPRVVAALSLNMPVLEWWIFPLLFLTGLVAGFVDSIARETVRQILKKMSSSRGSTSSGVCQR